MGELTEPVTKKDHAQGGDDAPCTLVEYGDYECPSCAMAAPIVKRVEKHFGDRLRFVFRNFPLEMHAHAEAAAETAEFAAAHGKFWEMHDALFAHGKNLSENTLAKLVEQLGLDEDAWRKALTSGEYKKRVAADLKSGEASGVDGTPSFYINGARFDESYDYDSLVEAIEGATAEPPATKA